MSASDMLGYRDVCGLSTTHPCPRQWISVRTMPNDVGMSLYLMLVTSPHMTVRGDITVQHLLVHKDGIL